VVLGLVVVLLDVVLGLVVVLLLDVVLGLVVVLLLDVVLGLVVVLLLDVVLGLVVVLLLELCVLLELVMPPPVVLLVVLDVVFPWLVKKTTLTPEPVVTITLPLERLSEPGTIWAVEVILVTWYPFVDISPMYTCEPLRTVAGTGVQDPDSTITGAGRLATVK